MRGGPIVYRWRCRRQLGSSPFTRAGFTGDVFATGQGLPVQERYIGPNRPWREFRQVASCVDCQCQQIERGIFVAVVLHAAL